MLDQTVILIYCVCIHELLNPVKHDKFSLKTIQSIRCRASLSASTSSEGFTIFTMSCKHAAPLTEERGLQSTKRRLQTSSAALRFLTLLSSCFQQSSFHLRIHSLVSKVQFGDLVS
jgi:hypothetical protein